MISQVRTYFRERLLEVDSDFREHLDFFNIDNIADSRFDKAFHISYQALSSDFTSDQLLTNDTLAVDVVLFFKGYRDTIESFDAFTDLGHEYRINCIRPDKANIGENIKAVALNTMSWGFPTSNDNLLELRLNFSVLMAFNIC